MPYNQLNELSKVTINLNDCSPGKSGNITILCNPVITNEIILKTIKKTQESLPEGKFNLKIEDLLENANQITEENFSVQDVTCGMMIWDLERKRPNNFPPQPPNLKKWGVACDSPEDKPHSGLKDRVYY